MRGHASLHTMRLPSARTAAVLLVLAFALAQAQGTVDGLEVAGVMYVEAGSLAFALGDVVTVTDETLTWRGEEGVATFFAGSSVALLQRPGDGGPTEWPLSAPVFVAAAAARGDPPDSVGEPPVATGRVAAAWDRGWYLPLDAVQLLGVAAEESAGEVVLYSPDGATLKIVLPKPAVAVAGPDAGTGWEVAQLGAATGLRLFAHDQSLLLLDLDLLPLAFPEATAVIDDAAVRAGNDHVLLLMGTSLAEGALSTAVAFEQSGRRLEVGAPYRVHVYRGDVGAVGPGHEVAAVVLLPATFSLYEPLNVSWSGVEATITFRR